MGFLKYANALSSQYFFSPIQLYVYSETTTGEKYLRCEIITEFLQVTLFFCAMISSQNRMQDASHTSTGVYHHTPIRAFKKCFQLTDIFSVLMAMFVVSYLGVWRVNKPDSVIVRVADRWRE